jgi:type I restriction enzyme S subunit
LDGLEAVELMLSEVLDDNDSFRIDSLFFKKEVLRAIKNIKTKDYVLNRDISIIGSGTTPTIRDENLKHGIVLLKTNNIRNNVLTDEKDDFFYIDEKTDLKMKSSSLVCNDVLINIVGATTDVIGRSAIVFEGFPKANITQAMAFSRIHDKRFLASYLFILFQTYYGQIQVKRLARPTGQYNLNLDEVGKFIIPCLTFTFQKHIESYVKSSYQKLEESKKLYREAEELLLEELGLNNFIPSNERVAIKSFSESFGMSGRLDAEYYQLKYDDIIGRIKSYRGGYTKLNDLVNNYSGGFAFSSDTYLEEGNLVLIRINNIKNGYLDLSNAAFLPDNSKELSKKDIVQKNDVLISMSGTIGQSCKIDQNIEAMVNQRILKISVQDFMQDVLVLLLNSVVCSLQLERVGTGGVQTNISGGDILNILIPKFDDNIQKNIASKISESFTLRTESKQLLEEAKMAVERAIEQGETI